MRSGRFALGAGPAAFANGVMTRNNPGWAGVVARVERDALFTALRTARHLLFDF